MWRIISSSLTLRSCVSLAMLVALAAASAAAQGPNPLSVRAVRFYRADGRQTTVKAFVEVPAQLAEPIGPGRTDSVRYQVSLKVVDSAGVTLHSETWGKSLLNEPGASGVDIVEFLVAPGSYRLEATVLNEAGQQKARATVPVEGFTSVPAASDLLLSPLIRQVGNATDTVPRAGEFHRGDALISAAATLHLTPLRPQAYYLLEVYNPGELDQTGTMQVSVLNEAHKVMTRTQPAPVRIGPGGGLLKSQVDLEGLPEGRYTMTVAVDLGGTVVERSADFTMAPLAATVARNAELTSVALTTDEGFFAAMSEADLDSAAAPLSYVAKSSERGLLRGFDKLSPAAKRRFLVEFWRKRDPDPATQRNEAREQFYGAIDFANRAFTAGGRAAQTGWKTDRGRVYIKNGAPDDMLKRPSSNTLPYEVWRYTHGRSRYFLFADRSGGVGDYNLLATNDLNEPTQPGWREILKEDAVQDIGRYLGVDFYRDAASPLGN